MAEQVGRAADVLDAQFVDFRARAQQPESRQ